MVDDAEFTSYYGRPIIKAPVWKSPDVPLYLFLGGAAGTSSILGAMADLSGRPALTRVARLVAGGGAIASVVVPGARPGPAGAVPAHAAGVQADVGAVGGHLHPVAVQRGGRGDGGGGAAGLVPAAEAVRRDRVGAVRRADGDLHRGAAGQHRRAVVARAAQAAAVRVRRLGDGRRWRAHDGLHAGGRGGAVAEDGGGRGGDRAGRGAPGRERPRHRQRAVPRGPGREAACGRRRRAPPRARG